jgi:hypothetical protein
VPTRRLGRNQRQPGGHIRMRPGLEEGAQANLQLVPGRDSRFAARYLILKCSLLRRVTEAPRKAPRNRTIGAQVSYFQGVRWRPVLCCAPVVATGGETSLLEYQPSPALPSVLNFGFSERYTAGSKLAGDNG